ncbi:MAG: SusC/RagA family TonB-linked outer membrane protein [Ferruginibacter sp.]
MQSFFNYRNLYCLLCFLLISLTAMAQQTSTVTGTLIDENGKTVIATAHIKGTQLSTTTDLEGNFNLPGVKENSVLLITGVSIHSVEIKLRNNYALGKIILKTRTVTDENVTVEAYTGYQAIKPNEHTGAITVIGQKAYNQQVGTNVLDRLKDITNGLAFTNKQTNNFQSDLNISVRGLSTINGPLNPLVVLDNFIYEGNINNLNPNDIASVTILKDAAATSIYGARGGNGVIVLTSKKASFGQPLTLGFSSTLSVTGKPQLLKGHEISGSDYIDVEQFLFNNGYYDDQVAYDYYYHTPFSPAVQVFIQRQNGSISAGDSARLINEYKSRDIRKAYEKEFYARAVQQQYSLSLAGGTEKNSYKLAFNYNRGLGTHYEPNDKINLGLQQNFKPFKKLHFETGFYYTSSHNKTGRPTTVTSGRKTIPYLQLRDDAGNPLPVGQQYSDAFIDTVGGGLLPDWHYYPVTDYLHDRVTTTTEDLVGNLSMSYEIAKGINLTLSYQYQRQQTDQERFSDAESYNSRNLVNSFSQPDYTGGTVNYILPAGAIVISSAEKEISQNARAQVNFNRVISNGILDGFIGAEKRSLSINSKSNSLFGYSSDPLYYTPVDLVNEYPDLITGNYQRLPGSASVTATANRFLSLYSIATYTWQKKYSLSGSAREDGSNIFGANTNNRWKPLWSAGLGWEITKEQFYKLKVLPFLKIRTTLGISGNIDPTKTALPVAFYGQDDITNLPFTRINVINNPDLRWEQSRQWNIGIDFALVKQILSGSLDIYSKKGKDLYGISPYDYTTYGAASVIVKNVADMKGKGIDLILHSNNIRKAINWTTDFIFNYNTAKTTKYFGTDALSGTSLIGRGNAISPVIGKPLYAIAAFKWGGLDDKGDPQGYLDGKKTTDYTAILSDVNEKGLASNSVEFIGSASPEYYGSVINNFSYKTLTFSFNISYKLGYYFKRPLLSYYSLFQDGTGTDDFAHRWQKPGDENHTGIPALVYTDYPGFNNRELITNNASNFVLKGDQLRLQYINLGWQPKNNRLKNFQAFINIANLGILWVANKEKIDPDHPLTVPQSKTYSIGFRANF